MFAQIRKFLSSLTGDLAEEAARRTAPPAGMSRRGFLRAVGVTTAAVLVPAAIGAAPRRTVFESLAEFDPAEPFSDSLTVYTRLLMREDGFMRRILPPEPLCPPATQVVDVTRIRRPGGKTEVWVTEIRSLAKDGLPKPVSREVGRVGLATGS